MVREEEEDEDEDEDEDKDNKLLLLSLFLIIVILIIVIPHHPCPLFDCCVLILCPRCPHHLVVFIVVIVVVIVVVVIVTVTFPHPCHPHPHPSSSPSLIVLDHLASHGQSFDWLAGRLVGGWSAGHPIVSRQNSGAAGRLDGSPLGQAISSLQFGWPVAGRFGLPLTKIYNPTIQ